MFEEKLLLWKMKRGSGDALGVVYEKYKNDMLSVANALLGDLSAAEDVVHDVFVSFAGSVDEFKLTGSLKGYLLRCVANLSRDKIRARKREPQGLDGADMQASDCGVPSEASISAEDLQRLKCAIAAVASGSVAMTND